MLLDAGVWLALVYEGHRRHKTVADFVEGDVREVGLCRVTHRAVLRLVTNPAVMEGDALTRQEAWRLQDDLRAQDRVVWLEEPAGLEQLWRSFSAGVDRSHKRWTDDYLAAFAQASGVALVTLDRRIDPRYPSVDVVTLGADELDTTASAPPRG